MAIFHWWNNKDYDGGVFAEETPRCRVKPLNRYDFSVDDTPITITGVSFETDDEILLAGSDRYAIAITDNPLIQDNAEDVITSNLGEVNRVYIYAV